MLFSITFLFFLSFTSVHTQPTTTTYTNCNTTFSCGSIITNLSYPFTGGNRPSYCGPPEYYLTCLNDSTPILNHNRVTYQVLALETSQTTLILSRYDLYNTTCPSEFRNTTLNVTLFNYITPQNEMLSLFYGCNTSSLIRENQPANLFTCDNYGERFGNYTDSYSLVGPVPSDPVLRFVSCGESISVPVMRSAAELMTSGRVGLVDVLREGFGVNYSVPFGELCDVCVGLGGVCGFDSDLGEPICICGDRRCPFVVTLPPQSSPPDDIPGNGSSKRGMQIGLSVAGAVIAGVGLGWLIFYCKQRKKQRVAAKTVSWDIQPSPSTKGLLNSHSSAYMKSIPSYPSSKADIGADSTYFGVQVFDYCEIEEATDNFNGSRELGEGGFGTVYYGELLDGRRIAVKRMYENNFKRMEQFMNEVEILARLRHQHLVTLYGCTPKRSKELLLVYEFIPNGTVADHLHGNRAKSGLLSWPVRLKIAIESAEALLYLHKSEIIHRDVKTTNILLDIDFHVKVADFGLSRLFPTNATHVSTAPQGTPGYVDPEYYQCYHLTDKSDVYSFGVVLVELISSLQAVDVNRHRHDINLSNMAINKIHNHKLHELVDLGLGFQTNSTVRKMMTLVAELAFRCLQQERDMRPSMEEVLESLRRIEKEDLNDHKVEIDIMVDDSSERPTENIVSPSSDSVATNERSYGSNPH